MTATHHPRRHFNYSNVMSTLAVFLVIAGGTALAAALPKSSVKSGTVKDNSLKSKDLKDGKAVTAADVDSSQVQLRVGKSCPDGEAIRVVNVDGGVLCEKDDQGAGGGGPPSGPAAGSLTGNYPNPGLAQNSVGTSQIADNAVTGPKVASNSLSGGDIADGSLDSADVTDGGLGGADIGDGTVGSIDIGNGSLTGDDVGNGSLTGDDIQESSLGQVPSALLGGFGRTGAESSCDPESGTFITCAATPVLNVPAGARALILARVTATAENDADSGLGTCRLGTSSIGVVPNTSIDLFPVDDNDFAPGATLVGVTPPLPTGATSFGIDCNQSAAFGAIQYSEVSASVLLIAAN